MLITSTYSFSPVIVVLSSIRITWNFVSRLDRIERKQQVTKSYVSSNVRSRHQSIMPTSSALSWGRGIYL
jgi:uncharacterized membrane protein